MLEVDIRCHAPLSGGPKILAANHPTTIDPLLITLLTPEQISVLVGQSIFSTPVLGRYLLEAGHMALKRRDRRVAVVAAGQLLEAGRTVAIFPEGEISPLEGGFHRPCTGVVRLALITGAPVIPVGIGLQRERIRLIKTELEGRSRVVRWYPRGSYAMTVGEALSLEGDAQDRDRVRLATERITQRIVLLSQESDRRLPESETGVGSGNRSPAS